MLKKLWFWLEGKKRIIGIIVLFLAGGLKAAGAIDEEVFKILAGLGATISAVGVADAVRKMVK